MQPRRHRGAEGARRLCRRARRRSTRTITQVWHFLDSQRLLRALAETADQADQLLLALRRRADDHEQALRVILKGGPARGCRRPRSRRSAWRTGRDRASGRARRPKPPSATQCSKRIAALIIPASGMADSTCRISCRAQVGRRFTATRPPTVIPGQVAAGAPRPRSCPGGSGNIDMILLTYFDEKRDYPLQFGL
jgi:hypothetical protein